MPEHEPRPLKQSEFDGGTFTIDFLSDSPDGFEFQTRESLSRRQGKYGPNQTYPILNPLPLTNTQREKVTSGMKREVAFVKKQAKIVDIPSSELTPNERKKYMDAFHAAQKVGIRNIRQEGNTLTADTVFVPFPFYQNIREATDSPESIELADLTPTALILETSDGKLIVQHRSNNNSLYKGVLGASVAGHFDRPKGPSKPGTLPEITTDSIKDNITKEMGEEIGLNPDDIDKLKIVGFGTDKLVVHHEFLMFAKSRLTSQEIEEKANQAALNKDPNNPDDFDEKFFVINGDAASLRTLLTQVRSPMPTTHSAAFIAAWYNQMLEKVTPAEAKLDLRNLEEDIKNNYKAIDLIVRAHDPSLKGYDASRTIEEQGLPSVEEELRRTGLIS